MMTAGAGDSAGQNLASLGEILHAKLGYVFIVNSGDLLGAKSTNLLLFAGAECLLTFCLIQFNDPPFKF